ncbi:hypothetical protein R6Q59_012231 [Mikania micrantha]
MLFFAVTPDVYSQVACDMDDKQLAPSELGQSKIGRVDTFMNQLAVVGDPCDPAVGCPVICRVGVPNCCNVYATDSDASVSGNLASSNPLYMSSRTTTGVVSPRRTMASDSFPAIRFLQAPVATVLEYSGVLRPTSNNDYHESESLIHDHDQYHHDDTAAICNTDNGEFSIRILGGSNLEEERGGDGGGGRGKWRFK